MLITRNHEVGCTRYNPKNYNEERKKLLMNHISLGSKREGITNLEGRMIPLQPPNSFPFPLNGTTNLNYTLLFKVFHNRTRFFLSHGYLDESVYTLT